VVSLNSSAIYVGIGLGTLLGGATLGAGAAVVYGLGAGIALPALGFLRWTARVVR
jgi:predicted MFS family arabinose efflux permease